MPPPPEAPTPPRRPVDNRPAWVANAESKRKNNSEFTEDTPSSRGRLFVMTAPILSHSEERCAPMPLTVDNKLPGCTLRFGKTEADEVSFICHVDTCAAMSTGNLLLHQWIMTKYPSIVAEYTQYDDNTPFEPIRLSVALQGLDGCDIMKNKLTAVVRYWTPYLDKNGKHQVISFGLGESIAVNSIIGLPLLMDWEASICFKSNCMSSVLLQRRFPLIYESTKVGVPTGETFATEDFVRPGPIAPLSILMTNVDSIGITDSSRHESRTPSVISTTTSRRVQFQDIDT